MGRKFFFFFFFFRASQCPASCHLLTVKLAKRTTLRNQARQKQATFFWCCRQPHLFSLHKPGRCIPVYTYLWRERSGTRGMISGCSSMTEPRSRWEKKRKKIIFFSLSIFGLTVAQRQTQREERINRKTPKMERRSGSFNVLPVQIEKVIAIFRCDILSHRPSPPANPSCPNALTRTQATHEACAPKSPSRPALPRGWGARLLTTWLADGWRWSRLVQCAAGLLTR